MHHPRRLGSILLGLTAAACASGGLEDPAGRPNAPELTFAQFAEQAVYIEERDIYLVDGDTPVRTVEELQDIYNHIGRLRRSFGDASSETNPNALSVNTVGGRDDLWDEATRRDLTFCVSQDFGARHATVVEAMIQAGGAWAGVADVRFVHHPEHDASCRPSNAAVVFDVRPVNAGGEYLAAAFFPSWTRDQRTVLIDASSFDTGGAVDLEGILRHELGHVLGFRHEHTRPEAGTCFEDTDYRPLTPYDRDSVMHYPQCNGNAASTLALTAVDAEGARSAYGPPLASTPTDPTTPPSDPTVPGDPSDPSMPTEPPPPPSDPTPPAPTVDCKRAGGTIGRGDSHLYPPLFLSGEVTLRMTGVGDPDLYAWVAGTLELCISDSPGATEGCTLRGTGGPLFVEVYGYEAGNYQLEVCAR